MSEAIFEARTQPELNAVDFETQRLDCQPQFFSQPFAAVNLGALVVSIVAQDQLTLAGFQASQTLLQTRVCAFRVVIGVRGRGRGGRPLALALDMKVISDPDKIRNAVVTLERTIPRDPANNAVNRLVSQLFRLGVAAPGEDSHQATMYLLITQASLFAVRREPGEKFVQFFVGNIAAYSASATIVRLRVGVHDEKW